MTPKRPDTLPVPKPEAHAFITIADSRQHVHLKHYADDREWPNEAGDRDFFSENFDKPASVTLEAVASITAMTDSTFEQLCRQIGPRSYGNVISNKQDLECLAARHSGKPTSLENAFTLDQMQAYIMGTALYEEDIPWNQVARLYNESEPSQQQAIHGFFVHCKNRTLSVLMAIEAPKIDLPEEFSLSFESRVADGVTEIYSEEAGAWIRDDLFHQRYHVEAYHNNTTRHFLLSTAPTLEIAMAKATAYAIKARGSSTSDLMLISRGDDYLAKAGFNSAANTNDLDIMEILMAPQKLIWDFDWNGANQDGDFTSPIIPRKQLSSLIHKVEKSLGVQWTKVSRLENELGI